MRASLSGDHTKQTMSFFSRFMVFVLSIASCTASGTIIKGTNTAKEFFDAHEEKVVDFFNAGSSCDASVLVKDFSKDCKLFIQVGDLPSRELTGRDEIQNYYESTCNFFHNLFECFVYDIDTIEEYYFGSGKIIGNYGENDAIFHLCDGQDVAERPQFFSGIARLDKHGNYEIFHGHTSEGAPLP